MRLYNNQLSGNCWKARQILAHRGIEYERVELDVFDRSKRPEILGGKNPALRVPTLELDDGECLAESNAILWYLADGSEYLPDRPARPRPRPPVDVLRAVRARADDRVARFWITLLGREGQVPGSARREVERRQPGARLPRGHLATAATGSSATATRPPTSRSTRTRTSPRRASSTSRSTRTSGVDRPRRGRPRARRRSRTRRVETVSVAQLRRYVVAHQGYTTRFRRARAADIAATVHRLGCVQLDSISTVGRAHRLTLSSRIGHYPEARGLAAPASEGRIFEYWAHEACLVPIEDYPLFKRRMEHLRDQHWWGRKHDHDPEVKERVLAALRDHGALPTRFFEGGGGGGMWNWKPEKRLLEDLFAAGEVVVSGRDGFQRLYDLPERVIPRSALDAPTPVRGGVPARLRAARGAGPRRADRVGDRRALPVPGRDQGDAAGRRRARGGRARPARRGRRRRAAGRRPRRMPRSTGRRRAASCSARSTTSSGTAPSSDACSASTT